MPAIARVLADLDDRLAKAPADRQGALWRLAEPGRGLDANAVRLPPGTTVDWHREDVLDVLLVVLGGDGRLESDEGAHELTPHTAVWLPRTSRRALHAGPAGLYYLTVHARRPGMTIGSAAPSESAAGEPACLLHRVCAECGRLAEQSDARFCSRCGTALPDETLG
ncbi:zinc ribbon domain-containing protein [Streptomyces cavernae]|uniref:zinc ribbon domain-containing protein n=1 Tax=Streptomyces cavernae TaxID=2259034 RepID=UPI000FEB707C|nr:zinc ribbon domain-containing protein [Streptomyces cavernae]